MEFEVRIEGKPHSLKDKTLGAIEIKVHNKWFLISETTHGISVTKSSIGTTQEPMGIVPVKSNKVNLH